MQGRNPLVYLVVAEDGRKYKVLQGRPDNPVFKVIRDRKPFLADLDFVPRIVGSDERHIIAEFVDGEPPDPTSREFARNFGRNLAGVNRMDAGKISPEEFRALRDEDLDAVVSVGLLDRDGAARAADCLASLEPSSVTTCLDYHDMQLANFIRTPSAKLVFIDLGAFERGKPPGLYLFCRELYDRMQQDVFRQSYLAAGGPRFLFENERYLRIASLIERAGRYSRAASRTRFFDRRPRRHRLGRASVAADKLRAEIGA